MVVKVDSPPIARMPEQFLSNDDTREYFMAWESVIYQLWRRTGGVNDDVADTGTRELYPFSTTRSEDQPINVSVPQRPNRNITYQFQSREQGFNAVTKSVDYYAVSYDFVNAKSRATITLPKYPSENDVVIVRNGDGSKIKIDGNGKTINGEMSATMQNKATALAIHYFIDSDEWLIR